MHSGIKTCSLGVTKDLGKSTASVNFNYSFNAMKYLPNDWNLRLRPFLTFLLFGKSFCPKIHIFYLQILIIPNWILFFKKSLHFVSNTLPCLEAIIFRTQVGCFATKLLCVWVSVSFFSASFSI